MNRKIIILILIALSSGSLIISGCTSSGEKATTEQASGADDGLDGELTEDGEVKSGETATAEAAPAEGATSADAAPGDDIVADLGDDPTGENQAALPDQALGTEQVPPPADDSAPPITEDATIADAMETEPPPLVDIPSTPRASLKKIKDTPFKSHGRILNTVYVVRKGDNLNKIAEKLLGDRKRKKELIADNSMLSRGAKEGDKIYYNSPQRPDDTTTMMTYYEDKGVPARSYVTKEGDDLKGVAKELLGSKEAWKELWTTNPTLESKGSLPAGTDIRYWAENAEAPAVADVPQPMDQIPPPTAAGIEPPPPDMNALPPPSDTLPPPPLENAMLPPPPVAANVMPLPPPMLPQMGAKKMGQPPESFLFQDQETTMALGAGAIILLSVILIIVHRIKKGRQQRMRLGQTQV